jgi:hypothetical protein
MTYDDGYDEDYDAERDCEHDDVEIDTTVGRAYCQCCPKSWYVSAEEIDAELDRQIAWDEQCRLWGRQERRREFWRKLTLPIRWPIFRLLEKVWPRKSLTVLTDDEIPF